MPVRNLSAKFVLPLLVAAATAAQASFMSSTPEEQERSHQMAAWTSRIQDKQVFDLCTLISGNRMIHPSTLALAIYAELSPSPCSDVDPPPELLVSAYKKKTRAKDDAVIQALNLAMAHHDQCDEMALGRFIPLAGSYGNQQTEKTLEMLMQRETRDWPRALAARSYLELTGCRKFEAVERMLEKSAGYKLLANAYSCITGIYDTRWGYAMESKGPLPPAEEECRLRFLEWLANHIRTVTDCHSYLYLDAALNQYLPGYAEERRAERLKRLRAFWAQVPPPHYYPSNPEDDWLLERLCSADSSIQAPPAEAPPIRGGPKWHDGDKWIVETTIYERPAANPAAGADNGKSKPAANPKIKAVYDVEVAVHALPQPTKVYQENKRRLVRNAAGKLEGKTAQVPGDYGPVFSLTFTTSDPRAPEQLRRRIYTENVYVRDIGVWYCALSFSNRQPEDAEIEKQHNSGANAAYGFPIGIIRLRVLRAPPGETNAVRSSHAFRADGTLLLETIPVDEYRHDTPDRRTRLRQVWAKDADWWSEYQDYRDGVLQTSARLKQFIPAPAEKVEARTE